MARDGGGPAGTPDDHGGEHALHHRRLVRPDRGFGGWTRQSEFLPVGGDRLDAIGRDPQAAIEKRGIGGGEFQQPDLPGAECQGCVARQFAGNPQALRSGNHLVRSAGKLQQADRGGVDRFRQRVLHADVAGVFPLEIGRAPGAKADRRIQHGVIRCDAGLQGGQKDKGLEGRSGLAAGQHRAVERAAAVVPPADHRAHRTGGGVQHHHRALTDPGGSAWPVQQRDEAGLRKLL